MISIMVMPQYHLEWMQPPSIMFLVMPARIRWTPVRLQRQHPSLPASRSAISFIRSAEEELIIFVGESGAKRRLQYDQIINQVDQIIRDLEIRVKDAEANIIEVFDTETGTSVATRSLDADGKTNVLGFELAFEGVFDAEDRFNIASNTLGTGDNRNLQAILDLQSAGLGNDVRGGFQKMYNNGCHALGLLCNLVKLHPNSNCARSKYRS